SVDVFASRGRNNHLVGTRLQVGAGLLLGREKAGALEHDIDLELGPGQFGGIALCKYPDAVAVDNDRVAVDLYGARELTVRRVVLSEMRVDFGGAEVVDGNDFNVVLLPAFIMCAQNIAANTAVAIDGDADGHC